MKNVIFYFHGYNSSPQSDKVQRLKAAGDVYAFDINVDPRISIPFLERELISALAGHIHEDVKIIFVGTSLGGWYAAKLGQAFGVDQIILINPAIDPKVSLPVLGVSAEIADQYDRLIFSENQNVFIGLQDELLDFSGVDFYPATVEYMEGDHRFNGPEFDKVVESLIEKKN